MTDIDTVAFEAGDAPCNFTAGRVSAEGSSTAAHFSDTLGSIYVKAHGELLSARPPAGHTQPALTVIVEDSADGSSWATVASFAFDGEDDQAAAVDSPRAHLRASWMGVEGTWSVDVGVTSLATASGGGGGSLPDQWTVAADGGLKIQPDSASGHPLDIESVPTIGGSHITAESTGKVKLNSQSPTATPASILLDNGGAIPLTLQADGFIGLGPSSNVGVSEGGYLGIEGLGEVPADSEIGPGGEGAHGAYAVIYFDYTNGAAKLMCKARDINGDIVTGTICNLT